MRSLHQIIPSEPTAKWKELSWKQKGLALLVFFLLWFFLIESIFGTIEAKENARLKETCMNPQGHSCYDLQYVMGYCDKAYYQFIADGCTYQQINRSWWQVTGKKYLIENKYEGVNFCVNLS